jgi:hypothetical protein
MTTIQELQKEVAKQERVKRLFMANYFEMRHQLAQVIEKHISNNVEGTTFLEKQFHELFKECSHLLECPVCLEVIPKDQVSLNNCGHTMCKTCKATIGQLPVEQQLCPICKVRIWFAKVDVTFKNAPSLGEMIVNDGKSKLQKFNYSIVVYSDKCNVIVGNTFAHREEIKNMGCTWASHLKKNGECLKGWIFPSSKTDAIVAQMKLLLDDPIVQPKPAIAKIPLKLK